MEIKCVWNEGREKDLTVGKKYEIQGESELMYQVITDKEKLEYSLKERFVRV